MERRVVECEQGGLFSTIWVPFFSLKAVRLGPARLQRCPVHGKWEKVHRVDTSTLSPEALSKARRVRDKAIP